MDTTAVDLLAPVHRLSVDRYFRMGEAGLFDDGPRVELIDGVVVEMSPIGDPHIAHVMWLTREIVRQLPDDLMVSPQSCVRFEALRSAPEPDIAVLPVVGGLDLTAPALLIEVSDSSLDYDRITKARLYARHGVAEYWIVDVRGEAVEVHREPKDDTWGVRTVHAAEEVVRSVAVPSVEVALAPLFAFARQAFTEDADAQE